jgi:hypothetical protein
MLVLMKDTVDWRGSHSVRGQTILMLLLCASVFVSIGYFILNDQSPVDVLNWARNGFRSTRVGPVRMQLEAELAKTTAVTTRPRMTKPQTNVSQAPVAKEPEVVVEPPPPPPLPQPSASDALMGLTRSELLAKFAPPSLKMNSTSGGDVFEELYYSRKDSPQPTILSLRNGIVVSASFGQDSTRNIR